ncbi:MAG: L-histidine N(alpha)-methyltransferase [Flavobacterium sp.]|nr:MAG: L-histidine N(alpha)-methyltransferase [Flavobacterium sp.]
MRDSNTLAIYPLTDAANATDQFRIDVLEGLQKTSKSLLSKYFYDQQGDRLFQQIMKMPAYYLTKCELEIFQHQTATLAKAIEASKAPFELIELGAGDALKSSFLLKHLLEQKIDFTYRPIDISGHILSELEINLDEALPGLQIASLAGEYFEMLEKATQFSDRRKVVLFLGGNIGNMEVDEAYLFCSQLRSYLSPGDIVLIGFDLKKNPHQILEAYNDKSGITAAFNLNLLARINRELAGDLNLENFTHYQTYDPVTGACRSYLVSLIEQQAIIAGTKINFAENELIAMEISQKFATEQISAIAESAGFQHQIAIGDSKNWFVDAIWMAR